VVGRQVTAVVNLPSKQVGPMRSEILVLGAVDPERGVVLLQPDVTVSDGATIA